jgi:tetratricopeptide (TPR) repeat protein
VTFEQDADAVARTDGALAQDVAEYDRLVREAVSNGQLFSAIEMARDGLTRFGAHRPLQQQLALALTQTGALTSARDVLAALLKVESDEETLCLFGRVHKDLWRIAATEEEARQALAAACQAYGEAFERHGTYYPGINLAFVLAAAGDRPQAREVARKVELACRQEIEQAQGPVSGWLHATLGEALTHQGSTTAAAEQYRRVALLFHGRWRDLASIRRQAREILRFKPSGATSGPASWFNLVALKQRAMEFFGRAEPGEEWLDRCFRFPSVAVFSGAPLDNPTQPAGAFPPAAEAGIRDAIRVHLANINAGFGYSSAAAGGDLIFCECLLEMDAKVNLVLPCAVEAFKRQHVNFAGPAWERRFHHVLAHSNTCVVANPAAHAGTAGHEASPMGQVYANRMIQGLAALQAQALDLDFHALALGEGSAGGTAAVIAEWRRSGIAPHIVPLPGASAAAPARPAGQAPASPGAGEAEIASLQQIKSLLFAEVINTHRIGETQMPAFVQHFKGGIARLMAEIGAVPAVAESWAGAHFFAYDDLEAAGRFALALRDFATRTDWKQHGLPADLSVRIVLHAGPVFSFDDPTLRRTTVIGAHLNRVARIWPIAPAGQIYATQGFAALCGAAKVTTLSFEYLGYQRTTALFEDAPLFRMDRRR